MTDDRISATATVSAPAEVVFDVLADPSTHQAIDGTGWVREAHTGDPVTGAGQIFRMGMYHANHPDKHYEMANRISVFDPHRTIAWFPGSGPDGAMTSAAADDAALEYGGWEWRYDLEPTGGGQTVVTLTYDWSEVPQANRDAIGFPPFEPDHLTNSLNNLAGLAEGRP